jgi:CBS domain-containing protein
MLVKDVMTPSPICCAPADNLDAVAKQMREHDCGAIPVCDGAKLVGMITDRDITIRAVATGRTPHAIPVREVMTKKVFTVRPDDDVELAVDTMKGKLVRRLPVVNEKGEIVGIVAPSDLAPTLASHNVADFLLAVSYWNRRQLTTAN